MTDQAVEIAAAVIKTREQNQGLVNGLKVLQRRVLELDTDRLAVG